MASENLTIGTTPVNIGTALAGLAGSNIAALVDSESYTIQNQGLTNIFVTEVATTLSDPDQGDPAPYIQPGDSWAIDKKADIDVWAWSLAGDNLVVVVES